MTELHVPDFATWSVLELLNYVGRNDTLPADKAIDELAARAKAEGFFYMGEYVREALEAEAKAYKYKGTILMGPSLG